MTKQDRIFSHLFLPVPLIVASIECRLGQFYKGLYNVDGEEPSLSHTPFYNEYRGIALLWLCRIFTVAGN